MSELLDLMVITMHQQRKEIEELKMELGISADDEFQEMAYKDDDGYYRITGRSQKWDSYEDLCKDLNIEF